MADQLSNGLTAKQIAKRIVSADKKGDTKSMLDAVRGLVGGEHRLVANELRDQPLGTKHDYKASWTSKEALLRHIEVDHHRAWQLAGNLPKTRGFFNGFHKMIHGIG